ncbi:MAG: ATP-dependent zinc metalloprotease FtsH [Anaerolineae bacterium]|nr:ATP-dependent zinc metalloprotease FtsH [Anaerolineae bacterium]
MEHNSMIEMEDKARSGNGRIRDGCTRILGWFIWLPILAAIAIWILGRSGFNLVEPPTDISYSAFRRQLEEGNIARVTVTGEQIRGEFEEPLETKANEQAKTYTHFVTHLPSFGDDQLLSLLEEHDVEIIVRPQSNFSWGSLLLSILPTLLLLGLLFFLFNRMQSQAGQSLFAMGQSRAKLYDRHEEHVTFDDVAGARGAKAELEEIIEFLKNPEHFKRLGGKMPSGVLLIGPPGTGKTLLARAVAGEARVPFFSITGSDFMEMFVGIGASRVRSLFDEAKKVAPSIIFIDELDSIGRRRGAGLGGGHDEREQTLNQLLSELDGFDPNQNVIVMAATNRPDILDPALLRPGRFDRQVTVDRPTASERLKILEIHAKDKPLFGDVNLGELARGTPGFSGADLENLLNEAALLAARKNKDAIEHEDIEEARDKMLLGLERESLGLAKDELNLLAYHEAGHAIVAAVAPHAEPIHKVTIVPRGRVMGVTQQLPERDRYIYSREYMLDRLAVMMGGRAAEELALDTATSGAENDLKQASHLARQMVLDWGMSEQMGYVALGGQSKHVFLGEEIAHRREYSEATAREVDQETRVILERSYKHARGILKKHRNDLERLAEALLEREEIPGKQVLELIGQATLEEE